MRVRVTLLLFSSIFVSGCEFATEVTLPSTEPTVCIGDSNSVSVPVSSSGDRSVVTVDGVSALLTGEVRSGSGALVESTGVVSEVSVAGTAGDLEFGYWCVTEGITTFEVEVEVERTTSENQDLSSSAQVDCIQCNGVVDATEDFINSILNQAATYTSGFIDIVATRGRTLVRSAGLRSAILAHMQEQGSDNPQGVVTSSAPSAGRDDHEPEPRDNGDLVLVAMTVSEAVPLSTDHSLIYSAVFDSDGVEDNNWVFVPPFDWDLFQGADRWYQLIYNHVADEWSLTVTQVDNDQSTALVPSEAFATVNDGTVSFFIPGEELPGEAVTFRTTAFGHDGAFSEDDRGADVIGANPTETMLPLE